MIQVPEPRETDTPSRSIAARVNVFNGTDDALEGTSPAMSMSDSKSSRHNTKRRMSTGLAKRLHAFEQLHDPQNSPSPQQTPKVKANAFALPGMHSQPTGAHQTLSRSGAASDERQQAVPLSPRTPRGRHRLQPRPPPKIRGMKIDHDVDHPDHHRDEERDRERDREHRHRHRHRDSERDYREEGYDSSEHSSSSSSRKRSSSKVRRARSRSRPRHSTRSSSKSRHKSRSRSRHRHSASSPRKSAAGSGEWSDGEIQTPRKRMSSVSESKPRMMTPPFSPASDCLSNPADSPQPHIVLRQRGPIKHGSVDHGAIQPLGKSNFAGEPSRCTPMTVIDDPHFDLDESHSQADIQQAQAFHIAFENLRADHAKTETELNQARVDLNGAQFEVNQLRSKLNRVEHELDDLKMKKSQSSARTEELEQQVVSLKIALTSSKTASEELQKQVNELEIIRSKYEALTGEVASLGETKNAHLTEINELKRKVDTLHNDLAAKQKDLEEAEEFEIKLEEEQQYSKDLDQSYSQINDGYSTLYESYCNNLEELEDMRQKNQDFRDELKACSMYIRAQAARTSGYAQPVSIDILEQEVHLEAQEMRKKNLELRAREKTLFKANYERTDEVGRIRERNSMLQKQVDALEAQLKRTQDEKASLSPSFGPMRTKQQDEREFQEEITELRRIIDQKDSTITSLKLEAQDTFTKNSQLFGEMRAREENLKSEIEERHDEMVTTMRKLSDLQAEIERRDTEVFTHVDYSKELTHTDLSALTVDFNGGEDSTAINNSTSTIRELARQNESLRVELESYLDMAQRGELTPEIAQRITTTPRHKMRAPRGPSGNGLPQLPPKKPSKRLQALNMQLMASSSPQHSDRAAVSTEKRSPVMLSPKLGPQKAPMATLAAADRNNVFELPKQFFDMQQKSDARASGSSTTKKSNGGTSLGFFEPRGDNDTQNTAKLSTRLFRNKTSTKKENQNSSNSQATQQQAAATQQTQTFRKSRRPSLSKRIAGIAIPSTSSAKQRPTRQDSSKTRVAKHAEGTSTTLHKHALGTTGTISISTNGNSSAVVIATNDRDTKTSSATDKHSKGSESSVAIKNSGGGKTSKATTTARSRSRSRSRHRHDNNSSSDGTRRSSSQTRHAASAAANSKSSTAADNGHEADATHEIDDGASGRTWRKRLSKRWQK